MFRKGQKRKKLEKNIQIELCHCLQCPLFFKSSKEISETQKGIDIFVHMKTEKIGIIKTNR